MTACLPRFPLCSGIGGRARFELMLAGRCQQVGYSYLSRSSLG